MTDRLFRTACYNWHVTHRGRMVDFAGWEMPVQYASITDEHRAVRTAAGLFDISHMGRLQFTGPDACRFLNHVVTNDVSRLQVGQIQYALAANEQGGILDDVLVYRFSDFYMMVVNASNRLKILDWIDQHRAGFDIQMQDWTFERCMLALQGPRTVELLNPLAAHDIAETHYYWGAETDVLNVPAIVSRTGYTGEDGFEVVLAAEMGLQLWEALLERGADAGLLPCGLGCRDTLRLEAAMPLYGHELDEQTDPFTAGLSFAVKLDGDDFIGKPALIAAKADPNRRKRMGLEITGRRIAREGAVLYSGGQEVGVVTSGTFSPTLEKSIAMGYLEPAAAKPGETVEVDIRGKRETATQVKLPFYRRA
jgi:aminomethyltransferase